VELDAFEPREDEAKVREIFVAPAELPDLREVAAFEPGDVVIRELVLGLLHGLLRAQAFGRRRGPLSLGQFSQDRHQPLLLPASHGGQRTFEVFAPSREGPEPLWESFDDEAERPQAVLAERELRPEFEQRGEGYETDPD